ncbi:MAG: hypothetical protein HN855_02650 [Anaerolineae bacterium]|nr:hypothetical protein [Anaerolineae bacterium]MBT7190423.1 hypothetical protein [Anaerolineae bacterium]MBT7324038.1 hypothetical protein [Anaerolineae bacterium]MBT7602224.1 hypothetical protein [Anaerolineae bacterium]
MGISIPFVLVSGSLVLLIIYQLAQRQKLPSLAPTLDYGLVSTAVVQTVAAEFTKQAAEIIPTATSFPTSTATLIPETVTPTNTIPSIILPTMIVPTITPIPLPCDRAQLIRDISIQDNSPFMPGDTFVKTWRLKNIGSCTWTQKYSLVFVSGNPMDAKQVIPLPGNVAPNQTIDLSVTLKAPNKLGGYRGDWMLVNSSGTRFGIGVNGENSFWVFIRVMGFENPKLVYDFAANLCRADWLSSSGKLPCPGTSSATEGFVFLSDYPRLENRQENEWTILAHPNNASKGWVSGIYPEFVIAPNQHFIAWVGCLADSKGCNVIFRLDMKNLKTGVIKNLGIWYEIYDGKVTKIDIDLSQHAEKHVQFILTIQVNGGTPERANAFWFVPGIILKVPPILTPVPPTATMTPTDIPPTDTPTGE